MNVVFIAIAAQVIVGVALVAWVRARVNAFLGSDAELERVRREIGALIVELDASADRNITVLEDRLAALKELVATADRRIASLDKEASRRHAEAAVYDRLGRFSEPRPDTASLEKASREKASPGFTGAEGPRPGADRPEQGQAEPARDRASEAPRPATAPVSESVPFIRFSDKPLPIEEPFADKVVALSRRGFSSDIIAARLKATMAEVDLVLSLERERAGRHEDG